MVGMPLHSDALTWLQTIPGAVVVVFVYSSQSVSISTNVVSSNPIRGAMLTFSRMLSCQLTCQNFSFKDKGLSRADRLMQHQKVEMKMLGDRSVLFLDKTDCHDI